MSCINTQQLNLAFKRTEGLAGKYYSRVPRNTYNDEDQSPKLNWVKRRSLMVATAKKRPSQGVLYSRAFTRLRLKKKQTNKQTKKKTDTVS